MVEPDFDGWATAYNQKCSDGRTIKPGAFKHMDKQKVPLVWSHQHKDAESILGHALLEDRAFGTYMQGFFNQSVRGQHMKHAVQNGDIASMSIHARNLSERKIGEGKEVYHGDITEVSLCFVGANPGALIENVSIMHSDNSFEELDDEAVIYNGLSLLHSKINEGEKIVADDNQDETDSQDTVSHADDTDTKSAKEIFDSMTKEQQDLFTFAVAEAAGVGDDDSEDDTDNSEGDSASHSDDESSSDDSAEGLLAHMDTNQEGSEMTNVFDRDDTETKKKIVLSHAQQLEILEKARNSGGKLSDYMTAAPELAHDGTYGIDDIDVLFPDARSLDTSPQFIMRRIEWVDNVLNGVRKQPFAKIKSILADVTAESARAKGYVKGNLKKDEVLSLLKRTTSPTTIYKKQKLDRDDILDITDFDIVAWLKAEIRMMLNEEIARAILISDGRDNSDDDKIKDPAGTNDGVGVRSILKDHEMYAHKIELAANVGPESKIEEITRSRTFYRGSGSPSFYTTDSQVTDMLLLKDKVGRRLYGTEAELASVLRVKEIVPVEVMEEVANLVGIIVNLVDYTVGANRGGEITFFEDFDIDYNQEKYLMETRISGALTKPKSAIVITRDEGTLATASAPSFNGETNTITIPSATGVVYTIDGDVVAAGAHVIDEDTTVEAHAADGYYIPSGSTTSWSFTYTD